MIELRNYIAGEWERPGVELSQTICNSNTGAALQVQVGSTPAQVATAVAAAESAHRSGAWRSMPGEERAALLVRIAESLEAIVDDMAEVDALTTGVPITHTRTLARVCGAAFRNAAALAGEPHVTVHDTDYIVERLPLGPAAIIAPWNAPAGIACHKLASALAAGCPVLFKPSEWAPHSGQLIANAISELDLPRGVFQLLHGDGQTGSAITGDDRVAAVSFTGGLQAGRAVAAACASQVQPGQLELGGNNALIVLPDADLAATVDGVIAALTTLNGQWCRALGRLLVHESLVRDVLETTMHRLSSLRIGESLDHETEMGPLVHRAHLEHVQSAIDRYRQAGGEIHQSSSLPDLDGWFIAPTLITGIDAADATEEVFGPVATVHSFATESEAVALANATPYGLAGYVFGERDNAYRVASQLETGMVKVNSVTLFSPNPAAPRAAWKLSGIGEEGTRETFEFFRGTRVIGVPQGLPG